MAKVFRNGNSLAVVVPKAYAHNVNIRAGSSVEWKKQGKKLLLVPEKKNLATDVDKKFAKMVDEFITEHKDVLQELSHR